MFITRLLSGIVLVAAAIVLLYFGNIWLAAVLGILSLIGNYELLRVFKLEKEPFALVAYLSTIAHYVLMYLGLMRWFPALIVLETIVLLVIYVARYPKYKIDAVAKVCFTTYYVGFLLSYIYQVRVLEAGRWLVWLIIIGAWGSDTCAYVVGKLIGKRHFSELSPKKTIEGCAGGVIGAALIALIFSFFFPFENMFLFSPKIVFPAVALVSALISQCGDLAASAIKRNYDVKDYGNIIPGHGGVLDRFDSVIFVAPFVYYLLVLCSYIG